jgi:streptogramin lyase
VIVPADVFHPIDMPYVDLSSLTGRALKIAEIDRLIRDRKKIEAIKVFRETFGVGLAEAKDAVERMERGESVDISGMQVRTSRATISSDQLEAAKKISYTIGGSILITILVSLLIIGGVTVAVLYFTFSAIDSKLPVVSHNVTPTPQSSANPTTTPDMIEVLKIGGEGNGAGRFKDNRHVAVDGQGHIYSSDYSPHRIQVFDADGKFLSQWGPESGSNLYDLLADRQGNVYLANDKGIFKHEGATGKLIAKSANLYVRGIGLMWDGKIIASAGKSIFVLDPELKVVNEYKDAATNANSTFGFEKVTADGSGMIYALDSHANEICKFSADGRFLDRFASGAGAPHALAVDPQGRLFVSDTNTIIVLDAGGQRIRSLTSRQAFGMTFDQNGDLFIAARPYVLKEKLTF